MKQYTESKVKIFHKHTTLNKYLPRYLLYKTIWKDEQNYHCLCWQRQDINLIACWPLVTQSREIQVPDKSTISLPCTL